MEKGSSSSLHGLKFGKKIYFQGGGGLSPAAAAPHSPAKKGRTAVAHGGHFPRCQVEGCKVDLSDAKAYYSRHKVCGMHSKSPKVIVSGLEQRFCQQCSRFHQLPEFDEGKRSCRRRLAGHNERRRKPTRGTLLSPRYGTLCPSLFDNCGKSTGGFVMDFSSYPAHSGTDTWPNLTSQQNPYSQNPLSNHLLQGTTCVQGTTSEECNFTSALSLLSNQPWASRTHSSTLGAHNGSTVGQYPGSSWGLGQTLNHANSQYNGELGLTQPNEGHFQELDRSSVYDSSIQNMHWTL